MGAEKHYICSYQNPDSSIKFFILSNNDFTDNLPYNRFLLSRERIEFSLNLENEDSLEDIEKIFKYLLDRTEKFQKEKFPDKSALEILSELLKDQGINQIAYYKGCQKHTEIKHYYPLMSRRIFHADDLERAYRNRIRETIFRERVITNPKHQHLRQKEFYNFREQY